MSGQTQQFLVSVWTDLSVKCLQTVWRGIAGFLVSSVMSWVNPIGVWRGYGFDSCIHVWHSPLGQN